MISDLIEFGRWLNDNKLDDFGKNIGNEDYIVNVCFDNDLKEFKIIGISSVNDYKPKFFKDSIFSQNYYIETNQMFMISNNSSVLGLTPFFVKLDHDFKKKNENPPPKFKLDKTKLNRFYGKIETSKSSNKNGNEFNGVIIDICDNLEYFFDNIGITPYQEKVLRSFLSRYNTNELKGFLNDYYSWMAKNKEAIMTLIIKFKDSEKYTNNSNIKFYLACYFNSEMDLLNDIFYYYSKFLKQRNKQFTEDKKGKCSFCGLKTVVYPQIGGYSIVKPSYLFNFDVNQKTVSRKRTAIKSSRLKFCRKCNKYAMLAEDKLKKALFKNKNLIIIPKRTKGEFGDFLRIYNKEIDSFNKINEFLDNSRGFRYDLLIYTSKKGGGYEIKKYIENYRAYLIKFEKINLYSDGLTYLFSERFKKGKYDKSEIRTIFDLETIFKQFFINIKDEKIESLKNFHFYQIYTKDLTGKNGIFYGYDSKTVSIFAKYMHNIFNLIYELNEDALDKNMLNEIVLNSLIKLQKHNKTDNKNKSGIFFYDILRRLNYYFMLKKEILGDNMLKAKNVAKLKEIAVKYNTDSDLKKLDANDISAILEMSEKDPSLKYYLIGQFLGLIDNSKRRNDKKAEVFSNFVTNTNRNNIKNLFVTEVLQKNNFYIFEMNKKGKIIFKLLEENINSFFNESDGFSFEDYILLIFTGYYTENILSSGYGAKKKGDDK